VDDLRRRGIELEAFGDTLRWAPKEALTPGEVDKLRQHKAELISLIKTPCLVDAPHEWHANEVARRVEVEGVSIFWSDVLSELIAFVKDKTYLHLVPAGVVAFAPDELVRLFPADGKGIFPGSLKLIYEAKRHGGNVVDFQWKADGS
jgi:hypothetical protein